MCRIVTPIIFQHWEENLVVIFEIKQILSSDLMIKVKHDGKSYNLCDSWSHNWLFCSNQQCFCYFASVYLQCDGFATISTHRSEYLEVSKCAFTFSSEIRQTQCTRTEFWCVQCPRPAGRSELDKHQIQASALDLSYFTSKSRCKFINLIHTRQKNKTHLPMFVKNYK